MARPFLNIKSISLLKILLDCSKKTRDRSSLLQNWLFNSFAYSVTLAICLPALANARCENPAATLESVEGTVEWSISDGHWQQALRGDAFCYGDKIRVLEQRAAIRLANETVVRLRENSVVTLMPEDKGFWVELLQGAGHFLSRTPKQLTIKAAYLNAAIDGTEFIVAADGERNRVAVFEGDVRVFNQFGEVRLGEGTETSATATTAPDPARSIRLRDAAEWILYYPPLIIQNQANSSVSALIDKERYAEALNQLDQQTMSAEDVTLAASLALISGQPAAADKLLEFALQQNSQLPEANALQALKALTAGDDQAALSQTSALLQTAPENVSVLLAHAYALQSQGKIEEALKTNRRALSLAPDNLFILARTAELELSSGNTRAARKLIDRALQKSPNHSRVNTLAGFIALNRFANKEAQTYFRTAINSNDSEPLARLGLALALIQKGKLEQGRAEMEMAVLLDPGSSLLRSYLGKTYAAQDQNDWADTQYQLAKNLDPNDPTPWFYQAHLKHEENKPGEALELITTAIEKNDNRAVYRSRMLLDSDAAARSANLVGIYRKIGFSEAAKNIASISVVNNPADFTAHQSMVIAHSDNPKAQVIRSNQAIKSRLLAPVGAKELPVGVGETGLQIHPWASPGKFGTHESTYLFSRSGISGNFTSLLGSQNSKGYEWLAEAKGVSTSISTGQYDYKTDGYRFNNDLSIRINEHNLHYQASSNTKLLVQQLSSDEESGDLGSQPKSTLFKERLRRMKSSDRHLIGLSHQIADSSSAIILASKVRSDLANTENSAIDSRATRLESESDQFEAVYIGKLENSSYQIGGRLQNYNLDENTTIIIAPPGLPEFKQNLTSLEKSEYQSIYASIFGRATELLRGFASVGVTDIKSEISDLVFSRDEIDYKLGALLFPQHDFSLNLAHWKNTVGRINSHPSWGTGDPFYINTTEDVTNFATHKSTAAKLYLIRHRDTTISFDYQHSEFTENSIIVRATEKILAHDRTDTHDHRISIEHQINPFIALTAFSKIHKSKLDPAYPSSKVVALTNYENTVKIKFCAWQNVSILSEVTYLQQTKSTQTRSAERPIQTNDQGIIFNVSTEISPKTPTLHINAGVYNLFNLQRNFHHANLTTQSESITPSKPLWAPERTAVLHITYSF